jgi:flagellar L-ring protein precursor FlgH
MTWPMPEPEVSRPRTANSLWQPGSRTFFRDQRAGRVGDILRVNIEINDEARVDNISNRNRNSTENIGVPSVFGLGGRINNFIPFSENVDPANLAEIESSGQNQSTGLVNRRERIRTQVAALITQVLPNGNMVIEGSQEILVNFDIREVSVSGVIRPEDINSDNTIDSTQIAQARVTYSGRGHITDNQAPRWGQQVIDAISPF